MPDYKEIRFDVDDWAVCRLAELREQREPAQLFAVVDVAEGFSARIVDLYIERADGSIERKPER